MPTRCKSYPGLVQDGCPNHEPGTSSNRSRRVMPFAYPLNIMNEVTSSLQAFESLKNNANPFAEELWVIALGPQLQILGKEMIFRGTADQCFSHPRDVFRFLILLNATSFILAHNHPSQEVLPSEQDLIMTKKMHSCGKIFQMPLIYHVIFTSEKYFSMADNGYFISWNKKFRQERYY